MPTARAMIPAWIIVACSLHAGICLAVGAAPDNDRTLTILPGEVRLLTTKSHQQLVVQWVQRGGQLLGQVDEKVQWSTSDDRVARVAAGVVAPVGNGTATITAEVNGKKATAKVIVANRELPFTWNFRNHLESVLSKSGCNAGACHAARAGKKGFRLTLFGFDADADYAYLTKHARGRRIVRAIPPAV